MAELAVQEPKELRKEGELAVLECALCEGRGGDPLVGGKCPVCSTRGYVWITEPYVRCNHCRGFGVEFNRLGNPTSMTCVICKGKGVVHVSGPTTQCSACGGTGKDPKNEFGLPCVVCAGKGFRRA